MPWTSAWDDERVVTDGDAWFAGLAQAISAAQVQVEIEFYIITDDAASRPVLAALIAAAHRGVQVRILVDGAGSAEWLAGVRGKPALARAPIELRVWHPLPWAVRRLAGHQHAGWNERWHWLLAMNRRDHRKLCLIDAGTAQAEAWVGSFNLTASHSATVNGAAAWRDCGAVVRGRPIAVLAEGFEQAWAASWRMAAGRLVPRLRLPHRIDPRLAAAVRLNHGMRQRRAAYRELIARIHATRERLWIANAYWVPRGSLLRALAAAAGRGVDVRVLTPGISDYSFMVWVAISLHDGLVRSGVRVGAYRDRFLHAKTMLLDDHALVGSHNLNHRSLIHDLEAEVILRHPASLDALKSAFLTDWSQADPVTPPVWHGRPTWQRLVGRAALHLKYWL